MSRRAFIRLNTIAHVLPLRYNEVRRLQPCQPLIGGFLVLPNSDYGLLFYFCPIDSPYIHHWLWAQLRIWPKTYMCACVRTQDITCDGLPRYNNTSQFEGRKLGLANSSQDSGSQDRTDRLSASDKVCVGRYSCEGHKLKQEKKGNKSSLKFTPSSRGFTDLDYLWPVHFKSKCREY